MAKSLLTFVYHFFVAILFSVLDFRNNFYKFFRHELIAGMLFLVQEYIIHM
jgi:hypothetical protein